MRFRLVAVLAVFAVGGAIFSASASAKGRDVFKVCKHGCKYSSVQKAVDKVKKGKQVDGQDQARDLPRGRHPERPQVRQAHHHRHQASRRRPSSRARTPSIQGQPAQNGIDAVNVDGLQDQEALGQELPDQRLLRPRRPGRPLPRLRDGQGLGVVQPLLRPVRQALHRRPDHQLEGLGPRRLRVLHRRDARRRTKPKWTDLDHDKAYENVLGYSGTNSKYVDIHDSNFYNNGAGVVPNTLDSERSSRTPTG